MTDLSLEDRGRLPSHVWKGMNEMMAMIVADDDWWDDADEEDDQFFMYLQGSLFPWQGDDRVGQLRAATAWRKVVNGNTSTKMSTRSILDYLIKQIIVSHRRYGGKLT